MDRNSRQQQFQPEFRDVNNVAGQFTAGGFTNMTPDENARALERGDISTNDYARNQQQSQLFNPDPLAIPKAIGGALQQGFNFGRQLITGQDSQQDQNQSQNSQGLPGVRDRFSTRQSDDALRSNTGFTSEQTRDFLNYQEGLRRDQANDNIRRQVGYENLTADRSNAIANANTGRNMAVNSQNTLNSVYQLAGQRLNDSARDTQNSLNNAANTVASLFR